MKRRIFAAASLLVLAPLLLAALKGSPEKHLFVVEVERSLEGYPAIVNVIFYEPTAPELVRVVLKAQLDITVAAYPQKTNVLAYAWDGRKGPEVEALPRGEQLIYISAENKVVTVSEFNSTKDDRK